MLIGMEKLQILAEAGEQLTVSYLDPQNPDFGAIAVTGPDGVTTNVYVNEPQTFTTQAGIYDLVALWNEGWPYPAPQNLLFTAEIPGLPQG